MKKLVASLLSILFCLNVSGQEQALSFSQLDSLPEIIQYYLRETTSKHFEDPRVPRFLIKDRTDNFVFGVGGGVEAKLFYDSQGNRTNGFEMKKEDESSRFDNDVLDFNLKSTNLSFKILGKTKVGVIDAFVSADFSGDDYQMKLQQAYVDILGLRIGKTNTAFRDDESMSLIDGNANVSNPSRKVTQIAYSYRFKNGIRLQGGVEFPQSTNVWFRDKNQTDFTQMAADILLPDITANLYYSGERFHGYVGGDIRMMNYYNGDKRFRGVMAYAFQGSMNWSFVKLSRQQHKLFLQALWTKGMADCMSSMRNKGLSVIIDCAVNPDGVFVVPNALGGSIGYQASFGLNTIDLAYSANSVGNVGDAKLDQLYKWGHAAVLNYLRTIFKYGVVGVEGMLGRVYDQSNRTYSNFRAYLYLRYNF